MTGNLQQALKELRLTMGKMEVGLGLIDEAIVWIGLSGRIEWCNGVFDRMVGRSHIEIIGKPIIEILPLKALGSDGPLITHPANHVLTRRELHRNFYRLNSEELIIELVGVPLKFPGEVGGAIFTLRDVSEQREVEEIRLQSLALQAAADAIVITDSEGHIEWVNCAFSMLTGYAVDEIYGQRTSILKSGETADAVFKQMWETITRGEVWHGELINRKKTGEIYREEQSITPVRNRDGEISHFIAIKRDVTAREKAEEEIMKLSSVVMLTDNAVIITTPTGHIEWVNKGFIRMTGYTLDEVTGMLPSEFLLGPESNPETVRHVQASILEGKGFNVELVAYTKSKEKIWFSIETRPLYEDDGRIKNFLAIISDITERKRSEEQLAAARRKEIEIASRIQRTLLQGRSNERIKGAQLAALSVPSQQVDGDFFDCFVHSEECMDVVIGDVMGKGVPAALLGGAAKSAVLRSICSLMSSSADHRLPRPREIMMSLHAGMVQELIDLNSFVTLVYARICSRSGTLRFVDCGHARSIHCRAADQSCDFFSGNNSPLGFTAREQYEEFELKVKPGDVVVFYSDGITETENTNGVMFGEQRLLETVRNARHLKCDDILRRIHEAVCAYSVNETFGDDLTCIVIKMNPEQKSEQLADKRFRYAVDTAALGRARSDLEEFMLANYSGERLGTSRYEVLTGVNEAFTNIIQHAFDEPSADHMIEMGLSASTGQLEIQLFHNGASFTGISSRLPSVEGSSESGFGMYIMEQSVDSLHYMRREDGWNGVIMKKEIPIEE